MTDAVLVVACLLSLVVRLLIYFVLRSAACFAKFFLALLSYGLPLFLIAYAFGFVFYFFKAPAFYATEYHFHCDCS